MLACTTQPPLLGPCPDLQLMNHKSHYAKTYRNPGRVYKKTIKHTSYSLCVYVEPRNEYQIQKFLIERIQQQNCLPVLYGSGKRSGIQWNGFFLHVTFLLNVSIRRHQKQLAWDMSSKFQFYRTTATAILESESIIASRQKMGRVPYKCGLRRRSTTIKYAK